MPRKSTSKKITTWEFEFEGPMRHPPFKTVMLLQKGLTLTSATKKARRKAQKKVVNPRLINAKQLLTEPNQQS